MVEKTYIHQQKSFDKNNLQQIFSEYPLYHFFLGVDEKIRNVQTKIAASVKIPDTSIFVSLVRNASTDVNRNSFSLEFYDERMANPLVFSERTCMKLPYGAFTIVELGRKVEEYVSLCGENKIGEGVGRTLFDKFVEYGDRPFFRPGLSDPPPGPVFKSGKQHNGIVDNNVELLSRKKEAPDGIFSLRVFFSPAFSPDMVRFHVGWRREYYEFPLPVEYTRSLTLDEMVLRFDYGIPLVKGDSQKFFSGLALIETIAGVLPKDRISVMLPAYFKAWDTECPTFYARTENQTVLLLPQRFPDSPICVAYEKEKKISQSLSGDFWGRVILSGELPKKTWNLTTERLTNNSKGDRYSVVNERDR